MALKAWEEFSPGPLEFPIGGKVYVVPELGHAEGLTLSRIIAGESTDLDDADPQEGWRLVLGAAYEAMVADNVPAEALARAGFAAMADFQFGRETAEQVWESGLNPEALAAAVTAANQKAEGTPSTRTGGAGTTPRRASTSGTRKSRKK